MGRYDRSEWAIFVKENLSLELKTKIASIFGVDGYLLVSALHVKRHPG